MHRIAIYVRVNTPAQLDANTQRTMIEDWAKQHALTISQRSMYAEDSEDRATDTEKNEG